MTAAQAGKRMNPGAAGERAHRTARTRRTNGRPTPPRTPDAPECVEAEAPAGRRRNTRAKREHDRRPATRQPRSPSHPSLQSQSLSRSYGSNLPTSLTYINLSTRDSKLWRPAADSVQSVESLRAPFFDFQGPRREYRHSNLMPCSTSLSNHISL